MKRLFDLVCAAVGLTLLLPLFVLIGVAIRLDSPGPTFFLQRRIGHQGRAFKIIKFRTMVHQNGQEASLSTAGDPRVTRVGRWLRASKLDELPQLINVLNGSMSLVGPRPELPRFVTQYDPDVKTLVLSVRPGITDRASIAFRDEGQLLAQVADPEDYYRTRILPAKLAFHMRYAREHNFYDDLRILAATFTALLARPDQAPRAPLRE
jgi:lipopolysaccharide/colanic/teichoic acid biosynthesis glycosyltransferase